MRCPSLSSRSLQLAPRSLERGSCRIARVLLRTPHPFGAVGRAPQPGLEEPVGRRARAVYRQRRHRRRSGWASPRRSRRSRRCMRAYPTQVGRSAWSDDSRTPACRRGLWLGRAVFSPGDPGFQPTRYWRGLLADPELGAPARSGALRIPGARRAGPPGSRGPQPERGVLGALRPAHRQGARREQFAWTAALVLDLLQDGGHDGRWGRADIDFDRISCYTRMTNRVERGIRRTDRRNVARVHPRSAGSKVTSSACGRPSGKARCISAQEGPL